MKLVQRYFSSSFSSIAHSISCFLCTKVCLLNGMKYLFALLFFFMISTSGKGQNIHADWYSESDYNGIIIQNSYPKGGPYTGPTEKHFNYSYLVFFSRVINETSHPIKLDLEFSADSVAIPGSPETYVKVFLPADTMTMEKRSLFSYGVTEL